MTRRRLLRDRGSVPPARRSPDADERSPGRAACRPRRPSPGQVHLSAPVDAPTRGIEHRVLRRGGAVVDRRVVDGRDPRSPLSIRAAEGHVDIGVDDRQGHGAEVARAINAARRGRPTSQACRPIVPMGPGRAPRPRAPRPCVPMLTPWRAAGSSSPASRLTECGPPNARYIRRSGPTLRIERVGCRTRQPPTSGAWAGFRCLGPPRGRPEPPRPGRPQPPRPGRPEPPRPTAHAGRVVDEREGVATRARRPARSSHPEAFKAGALPEQRAGSSRS
jgi:hypothetical protein